MNETIKTIKDHLLFLIDLETQCMFKFHIEKDEKMEKNCRTTRNAYYDIYDYVMLLQAEEDYTKETI